MRNHVPVITVLISSIICAMSSSTSTKPPFATAATTTATSTTGAAPSKCPGVGQLGKQYTIVSARHYTGFVWVRPSDGLYVVTCNPSCSPIAGYRAIMNDTHATLTIDSLTMADVGAWGLVNANKVGAVAVRVCVLSAAGLPQCSVRSDEDTNSLEPGAQLTITVDITDYYCSVETGFDLTTGAVTEELVAKHNVTGVSTNIVNQTFNVDVTRLGDLTVTFLCGKRWNLLCGGVKKLIKSPPQCDVSSDTDTNTLGLGTYLTLTVDIKNYYCPQETGFNLTTGHVTDELRAAHKVSHVSDLSVNKTVSVDIRRLGDVTLNYVCDRTLNLTCTGVQELFKSPPHCDVRSDTDTNTLGPGTNLTLTVDIKNYYCPQETGFNLTTGAVTEELVAKHNVTGVSTDIVNQTFNVDVTRLGDLTLTFLCGKRWNLLCGGVKKLIKSPPHCDVSSDTDTNTLVPGTNLTLTVDIKNYYCPQETGFNLTTGHVTDELRAAHKVSHVSDLSVNKTVSVDIRRLGDVTLNFVCDRTLNLTCTGVQELFKAPPQCNISSDTDTNALEPGTNLTLTVDIKNVYCSQQAGFVLTTGGIQDVLLQNLTTVNIMNTALTTSFIVTPGHLGDVSVTYICDNTSTSLTCGGIDKLTVLPSTTTPTTTTSPTTTPTTTTTTTTTTSPTTTVLPSTTPTAATPTTEPSTTSTTGPLTQAGSPAATELTKSVGVSSPTVTPETRSPPTVTPETRSPPTVTETTSLTHTTLIIVIVLLLIVFLIIIIIIIVCCRRKYHTYRMSQKQTGL